MITNIAKLIGKDRKLMTLFSGMVTTGMVLVGLVIATGVFYL